LLPIAVVVLHVKPLLAVFHGSPAIVEVLGFFESVVFVTQGSESVSDYVAI
jgi:hypothetical protein